MLITGRLDRSAFTQLLTVINTVINRPVNISGIIHSTLVSTVNLGSAARHLRHHADRQLLLSALGPGYGRPGTTSG